MKYEKFLNIAQKRAIKANKEPQSALFYLMHVCGMSSGELYANFLEEISKEEIEKFNQGFSRHLRDDYPIQYLIGHQDFFGYNFFVDNSVLIPRFETEELVEHVLEWYDEYFSGQKVEVLDLCCGSGCIGLTLAMEEENMSVTLSDISAEAVATTKKNALKYDIDAQIILSDLFLNVNKKFDIIVTNPPYIPLGENVPKGIRMYEPNIALFGGVDGLAFYRRIIKEAQDYLKPGGFIAFEHAFDTKESIADMLMSAFPNGEIKTYKDLQKRDRITLCKRS